MKKALHISIWVLVLGGLITLLSFADKERAATTCWKFEVDIERENDFYFIDDDAVKTAIYNLGDSIVGTPVSDLNVTRIRQEVKKIPAVKEVNVVKSVDGRLTVEVFQRTPIARLLNKDGSSFYLDNEGRAMPLSKKYTARVPVLYGNIMESAANISVREIQKDEIKASKYLMDDLFDVVKALEADPFWKAQIESIYVNSDREIELLPRVGNHRIIFGDSQNIDKKLKKLMAFYKETVHAVDLNKYKTINLKYRDQVVCQKYY
ncbi:cell division protein FtsQ/DivIB [Halocola ammonii]